MAIFHTKAVLKFLQNLAEEEGTPFSAVSATWHASLSPKHKYYFLKIHTSYRPAVALLNSKGIHTHSTSVCIR